jgi:hypothetical protein
VRNVLRRMARATRNFSARWATDVLDRLRKRSEAEGISKSRLAERYVDEGIRMDEHPGIEFRDGPAGRRASLHGGDLIVVTAEYLNLAVSQVEAGVRYYADYPEDIDERITANTEGSAEAEAAWLREQVVSREAAA